MFLESNTVRDLRVSPMDRLDPPIDQMDKMDKMAPMVEIVLLMDKTDKM